MPGGLHFVNPKTYAELFLTINNKWWNGSIIQRKFRSMKNYTCTSRLPPRQKERFKQNIPTAAIYGDWLDKTEWSLFCTFTTRYSLTVKSARRSMQRFNEFLTTQYSFKTTIFWVAEPFDTGDSYHVHALLKVEGKATDNLIYYIKKAWQIVSKGKNGKEYHQTILRPYEPSKGAHFYVAKYIHRPGADYDIL